MCKPQPCDRIIYYSATKYISGLDFTILAQKVGAMMSNLSLLAVYLTAFIIATQFL